MDKKFMILIVDDEPNNLKLLQQILTETYRLKFANDGTSALAAAEKHKPDLILLDIMMPGIDGYEVCRKLKDSEGTKNIPVIFVTAKSEIKDEQQGLELGALDYIIKPISPPIVKARVKNHLALKEARDHLEELVAERTHALNLKVKELEGRDQLVRFQMQSPDINAAGREVVRVISEVLTLENISIFLPDKFGNTLHLAGSMTEIPSETLQHADLKNDSALQLASKAFLEKRVVADENKMIAAPILYKDDALGVIWITISSSSKETREEISNILWRMATEAAMVFRMAKFTEDLKENKVDFDKLMDLAEQNL
ncbi:MAG: response regulator [Desulfobulbaceae bacterium]|nr:response regulator [Desulfobulbaceae bacterium]